MERFHAAELLGEGMLECSLLQNWPVGLEGQTLPFNTKKYIGR
jgi:hypothetical protein